MHYTFQRCKDSTIPCTTSGPLNCNALETELYMQAFPALEDLRPLISKFKHNYIREIMNQMYLFQTPKS